MKQSKYLSYKNKRLHIENIAAKDIAKQYGTPCYVYSYHTIADAYKEFEDSLTKALGSRKFAINYAVKANSNLSILKALHDLGSGFDLVSVGELKRVLKAGGDATNCIFSGVAKTKNEIKFALENNIGCLNVESIAELEAISEVATDLNMSAPITLRVNPNIDAKTHPYISTGMKENKFGIAHHEVLATYQLAKQLTHLKIKGIACHIGSQITDLTPFRDCIHVMINLVEELKANDINIDYIDIGGGLGVFYKDENPPSIGDYVDTISSVLKERNVNLDIHLEPGRRIVANAGVLLTEVVYLKQQGDKNFAIVDAGMNDIIRPMLYQGWHEIQNIDSSSSNEPEAAKAISYDIVGPVCESTDTLAHSRELNLKQQDVLAVFSAGAYCMSMSSTYNSRARPTEILVNESDSYLIRQRDSFEDVYLNEKLVIL